MALVINPVGRIRKLAADLVEIRRGPVDLSSCTHHAALNAGGQLLSSHKKSFFRGMYITVIRETKEFYDRRLERERKVSKVMDAMMRGAVLVELDETLVDEAPVEEAPCEPRPTNWALEDLMDEMIRQAACEPQAPPFPGRPAGRHEGVAEIGLHPSGMPAVLIDAYDLTVIAPMTVDELEEFGNRLVMTAQLMRKGEL